MTRIGHGIKTSYQNWPYELKLFDERGDLVYLTRHRCKSSYDMEVNAARSRGVIVTEEIN